MTQDGPNSHAHIEGVHHCEWEDLLLFGLDVQIEIGKGDQIITETSPFAPHHQNAVFPFLKTQKPAKNKEINQWDLIQS